jgi:hypothetical protein
MTYVKFKTNIFFYDIRECHQYNSFHIVTAVRSMHETIILFILRVKVPQILDNDGFFIRKLAIRTSQILL